MGDCKSGRQREWGTMIVGDRDNKGTVREEDSENGGL